MSGKYNNKLKTLIFCMMISGTIAFSGCGENPSQSSSKKITVPESSASSEINIEPSVSVDKNDTETDYNEAEAVKISLNGSSAEINGNGASTSGSTVTISSAGTYAVSGKLDDGQIVIEAGKDDIVKLVLDNATVNSTKTSAIYSSQCEKTIILLPKGSKNEINGGTAESDGSDDPDAAIYSKNDLTISGEGELKVNGSAKNGITSKDTLKITGGSINVSAENNGITGKDDLHIQNSSISVDTKSGDGLKSNNSEKGNIYIESSEINITAANDGIQAENDLTVNSGTISITTGGGAAENKKASYQGFMQKQQESSEDTESMKGLKAGSTITVATGTINIDSYDDSIHSNGDVKIGGGIINIKSGDDGIHADKTLTILDGNITVNQSYEGLEADDITISGGTVDVTASDDGVNCSGGNDTGFGGMGGNMPFNQDMQNNGNTDNNNQAPQSGTRPEKPEGLPPQMNNGEMPSMPDGSTQNNNSSEAGSISISGGTLYITAQGDGLDSNGELNISGGTIIINGTTSGGNSIIDHDGSCSVTGGYLAGAGTSDMLEMPASTSSQCSIAVLMNGQTEAGKLVYITDNSGKVLMAMTPEKSYSCVIFSSSELKKGETYKVYTGGNVTGDSIHGYYAEPSVSGGTLYSTFTISDSVSYVDSNGLTQYSGGFGGMGGMGRMGNMRGGRRDQGTAQSSENTSSASV